MIAVSGSKAYMSQLLHSTQMSPHVGYVRMVLDKWSKVKFRRRVGTEVGK